MMYRNFYFFVKDDWLTFILTPNSFVYHSYFYITIGRAVEVYLQYNLLSIRAIPDKFIESFYKIS